MSFIEGRKVNLRPLTRADVGERWLGWLNNPFLLKYRGPKAFPSVLPDLYRYVEEMSGDWDQKDELRLAVMLENEHIGNITLGSMNWVHRSAELNILIGETSGQGHGTDAIVALTKHALENMGLLRVWAESPNPAFNKIMCKLKWAHEGTKREAFLLDGKRVDIECWGLLAREQTDLRPQLGKHFERVESINLPQYHLRKIVMPKFPQGERG